VQTDSRGAPRLQLPTPESCDGGRLRIFFNRLQVLLDHLERRSRHPPKQSRDHEILVRVHLDVVRLRVAGPRSAGRGNARLTMRACFQRASTRSPPMKLKRLSRCPIALLPSKTSVWSTPSIGRSVGILPPTMWAKVGKKSMIENIAYDVVFGLTWPGQRMIAAV